MWAEFITELFWGVVEWVRATIKQIPWRNPMTWFAIISAVCALLAWTLPRPYCYVAGIVGALNLFICSRYRRWAYRTRR